jgi:radical SAM protein (TIGR01212 family)
MNEPYYSFSSYLKRKFCAGKVRKIPINAGMNCPNKDGTKSSTGCIFCDAYGSGPIKTFFEPIEQQIESYIKRYPGHKFIAYYQAHSNTYGPVSELRQKYEKVFKYPDIIGLFIGTRPDSISDDTFPLLDQLKQRIYLSVELGLQTIHAGSLDFLNRNHTYTEFLDTFNHLKSMGIDVVVHLIIGIPGETREDMLQTVHEMNRIKPAGIKFHLFHILRGSPLFDMHLQSPLPLLTRDGYVDLMVLLLKHLHPEIVIHRLTGERDREIFFAPSWALNKMAVIESIRQKLVETQSVQGSLLSG